MKFIAHRGFWYKPEEKNTFEAFERAIINGFGIETDFRDCNGQLIISHDVPIHLNSTAFDFIKLIKKSPPNLLHAINIKSDGIHSMIKNCFSIIEHDQYFVFDMSIPDALSYINSKLPFFVRCSEYEEVNSYLLDNSKGVWLDSFNSDWFDQNLINSFFILNKIVCIVSPELHKRPYLHMWKFLKDYDFHKYNDIFLCTDYPQQAKEFFSA
jgi:hypothetical protein